jgi:hypothetical protein
MTEEIEPKPKKAKKVRRKKARGTLGKFKPKNPKKYDGDYTNIVYRSRWEALLMRYCDMHPHVISWSSEETIIPYRSPVDGRMHRYFMDFKVTIQKGEHKETLLIEVKPYAQTIPPKGKNLKNGQPSLRLLEDLKTYAVNQAKWAAAREVCAERGWTFKIFTEYELGIKKRT